MKTRRRRPTSCGAVATAALVVALFPSPVLGQGEPGGSRSLPLEQATKYTTATVGEDGSMPLRRAVLANDVRAVRRLARSRGAVNRKTTYGVALLTLAVVSAKLAVVRALLDAGADANTVSGEGETVLMTAARAGRAEVAEELLRRGADPNAREQWQGQSALMWAAAENHSRVVETLLRHGAEVNATTDIVEYWALVPSEPATPRIPLAKGGMSALHYAARQGALDAVRALAASSGIDLDQVDPDGVNALVYATLNGHYDVAAHLLAKGADPNVADQYGRTVLFAAIEMNRPDREPRPMPKSTDATTALQLAALALEHGAFPDAMLLGRSPSRCPLGCQTAGIEGATPLWRAARSSDARAVALLLEAGASPSLPDRDGNTPLLLAAGVTWRDDLVPTTEQESVDTVKLLMEAGASLSERNSLGETALHGAAGRGADTVVRFLVEEAGADLTAWDSSARTPLHIALGVTVQKVRQIGGGSAPVDLPVRQSTAALLRQLMTANGLAIEPHPLQRAQGPSEAVP